MLVFLCFFTLIEKYGFFRFSLLFILRLPFSPRGKLFHIWVTKAYLSCLDAPVLRSAPFPIPVPGLSLSGEGAGFFGGPRELPLFASSFGYPELLRPLRAKGRFLFPLVKASRLRSFDAGFKGFCALAFFQARVPPGFVGAQYVLFAVRFFSQRPFPCLTKDSSFVDLARGRFLPNFSSACPSVPRKSIPVRAHFFCNTFPTQRDNFFLFFPSDGLDPLVAFRRTFLFLTFLLQFLSSHTY